jgi:hypothetical protein
VLSIPDEDCNDNTVTASATTASTANTSPTTATATTSDACVNYYTQSHQQQQQQQQQDLQAAQSMRSLSQSQTAVCSVDNSSDDVCDDISDGVSTDDSNSDSDSSDTNSHDDSVSERLQCAGDAHYHSDDSCSGYSDSGNYIYAVSYLHTIVSAYCQHVHNFSGSIACPPVVACNLSFTCLHVTALFPFDLLLYHA